MSGPKATKFYHCFFLMFAHQDIWQGIPFTKKIGVPEKFSKGAEILQPARWRDPAENRVDFVDSLGA
jgi:hypothetical protein